jgi:predicted dehydrogenase
MVGCGMIFEETYAPAFLEPRHRYLASPEGFGICEVELVAIATLSGRRAEAFAAQHRDTLPELRLFAGPDAVPRMIAECQLDCVCIATPDDRHFAPAEAALAAGKHVLIEKPSVLRLSELDRLAALAAEHEVACKVVYHKLVDPDHKRLRTLVADGTIGQVHSGYCSLLEPKQISGEQFASWISGRNPATYVAVHYIKLIDFTFGGTLRRITATGQRGIVGPSDGPTWDSVQLRLEYEYASGRTAAFDIHTNWVTPDNFPGYVEQEVQFRFDTALWHGHGRRRGVELTVEGRTPTTLKTHLNNHYNAETLEPWGQRGRRGYGIEVLTRFFHEIATVEQGGPPENRAKRLAEAQKLNYNDLTADRQVVAAVEALEAILARCAAGQPNPVALVNHEAGGLVLLTPGSDTVEILYEPPVSGGHERVIGR